MLPSMFRLFAIFLQFPLLPAMSILAPSASTQGTRTKSEHPSSAGHHPARAEAHILGYKALRDAVSNEALQHLLAAAWRTSVYAAIALGAE